MTDPTTDAGRRLLRYYPEHAKDILAIEAEARAEGDKARMMPAYQQGRADALREAAERVRALDGAGLVSRFAVLAILDPETGP